MISVGAAERGLSDYFAHGGHRKLSVMRKLREKSSLTNSADQQLWEPPSERRCVAGIAEVRGPSPAWKRYPPLESPRLLATSASRRVRTRFSGNRALGL